MDVAFVGCGAVAHQYLDGLAGVDELDLVAVADVDADRADGLAEAAACVAYGDAATMVTEAEPALVLNLTGHGAHAAVTRACLESGAHVYSEKPLALDRETALALVELAESRDLGLGCAPANHRGDHQRLAAARIADGTLGPVRVIRARATVGRVTEWHDRPDSFLEAGALYDGAVYPLTLLVEWFGPVERVRSADAARPYPERAGVDPPAPTHVEATVELAEGPMAHVAASCYVPHGSDGYGLAVHGDDASLRLSNAGDLGGSREPLVTVAGASGVDVAVPLQRPPLGAGLVDGPARLAARLRRGERPTRGARRAAHVVATCDAIISRAGADGPVAIDECGFLPGGLPPPPPRPTTPDPGAAVRLPPIGFGCSRYRDGEYVDRVDSIRTALDAGYRFLDSAELYGNEGRIGDVLAAPGSPDRDALVVASKVWNTNHGHVREACETTLAALGVDALDCYLLHWPTSWAYTGALADIASLPPAEQEARTFPRDDDGEPVPGGVPLEAAWRGLEAVHRAGLARTIGLCNVDRETLAEVLEYAAVRPAVVQVERHPYRPRRELLEWCHARGIRVVAHSPLSAPGLLEEPALAAVAESHEATPAQVVLAWNVGDGVVPIPSSVDPGHVVENAGAGGIRLDADERERIAGLADPGFER